MRRSQSSFRRVVAVALWLAAGLVGAQAAGDPEAAQKSLTEAVEAGDPAAVSRALGEGAQASLPRRFPVALLAVERLSEAPVGARDGRRAVVEVLAGAGDPGQGLRLVPFGGEGSMLSRLAAVEGEEALFRRVLSRAAPEGMCPLLRTLLWGSNAPPLGPVLAVLAALPADQASAAACAEAFGALVRPGDQRAPGWGTVVQALLAAGIKPQPRFRPSLIELAPPGEEGAAAFARLTGLDLSALVPSTAEYRSWEIPALRFLASDLLESRAARAEGLLQDGRWAALLDAQPDGLVCMTLPEALGRGWSRSRTEPARDGPWQEVMRATLTALLRRCPARALPLLLQGREGQEVARGLLAAGEEQPVSALLRAGLQPAEPDALAREIACAGRASLLGEVLDRRFGEPTALLPPVLACLGPAEAPRESDVAVLELLLRRGAAADTKVDGDTPIAIAEALGRADVVEALRRHGARPARLAPAREAFWRYRRLAALAGAPRPPLGFEPKDEDGDSLPVPPKRLRLGGRDPAWLVRGECAMVNCDLTVILQSGGGYHVVLSTNGDDLSVRPERHRGMADLRIGGRGGAGLYAVQSWRFDGRAYQPFRCATREVLGEGGRVRNSAFAGAC
ncbi:hypothetical protein [Roseomonas sp. WA12]